MYPKIFDKTETEFSNNGLGFLPDVKKILVTEERNGGFYVEMEYPLNGVNAEYLKYDYIILVKPNPIDRPQPFRIYDTKKSKNNHSIAVKANHITFDDSQNFLVDFSRNKTTASTVLTQMRENRTNKNKITYSTDITTPITVDWSKRSPVNALAGEQGSFIQTLNSEIKRDMWSVTVNASRGRQSSFVARDEKGLTDFDLEEDVSSVVTKVYPFKTYKPEGSDEDKTITLKEKFIISENAGKYPFEKIAYLDLSQDETVTDEDSLRKVAQKQFTQEHIDLPKISGTLKIINLSKNPEYDFIGELSSVLLCDYIWCVSKTIKEKVQVQVNKVVYNPIIEDYDSLDVGIKKQSLGQSITNSINKVQNEVNKVQNQVNNIVVSADGTKSFYSDSAPTEPEYDLNDGDIWFQPLADGSINSWAWNDTQKIWQPIFNKEDFDSAFNDVNSGVEAAKKQAQEASNKADAIENNFNTRIIEINHNIDSAKQDAQDALEQANDAINKADFNNKEITDLKQKQDEAGQKISSIEQNYNGLKQTVIDNAEKQESDRVQLSDMIQDKVSKGEFDSTITELGDRVNIAVTNGVDVFPNPTFETGKISEFTTVPENDPKIFITQNPYKEGVEEEPKEIGKPYKVINKSDKVLRIFGKANGNRDVDSKVDFEFPVNNGEQFNITFDFRNTNNAGGLAAGIVVYDNWAAPTCKTWLFKYQGERNDQNWKRVTTTVEVPTDKPYKFAKFFFSFQNAHSDNIFVDVDNVHISRGGSVNTMIDISNGKILEIVQQGEALNQRVQTAESTIESIENMEGSNTLINTVKGQQQSIKDAQGNALEALETAKGTQTVIYNTGNIWMPPDFQSVPLSKYTYVSDTDPNIKIVDNGVKNSVTDPIKYNEPYRRKNPSTKAIRFEGRLDGNRDCFQKDAYNIQVSAGDVFDVGFDFYKTPEAAAGCGFKLIADDGSIGWIALYGTKESGGSWWHIDGQVTVPSDKNYVKAQAFISYGRVKSAGQYCYMDNVSIRRATGSTVGQFSKLTQTADLIKGEVSSLDEKTKASLALLQDNINLKVDKDGVINQINVSPEGILIDGDKIHLTGQTTIDNAIIPSAAIKDLSADKITTGTLNAANVNITNLDVNKLTGDYSEFLRTIWKDDNSSSELTADGIKFFKKGKYAYERDSYLDIASSDLKWYTSDKKYFFIRNSNATNANAALYLGAVTNGDTKPASININTDGYNTFVTNKGNSMLRGKYVYIGGKSPSYWSDGSDEAAGDLAEAALYTPDGKLDDDQKTYAVAIQAENDIVLKTTTPHPGWGIRFSYGDFPLIYSEESETKIVYQEDRGPAMYIKSIPTYKRTYSSSSNVFITENGYFGRSTSAKKYKQDIEYIDDLEEAKRTLDIQPAEWADKAVLNERANNRVSGEELTDSLRRRYIGFIADDFADAGFEKLVLRDDKGEVEEFQYDRLSVYHHQMIKDLYSQIDELKKEIKQLKGE